MQIKSSAEFNKEHVIPKAFGKFGSKTMTLECVCEACNDYFGKGIDLCIARDSIFGLLYRSVTGLLDEEGFEESNKHNKGRIAPSIYHPDLGNLRVNIKKNKSGTFDATIADQVLIRNSTKGRQLSFDLKKLPHKNIIESLGLIPSKEHMVFLGHPPHLCSELDDHESAINKSEINFKFKKDTSRDDIRFPNIIEPIAFHSIIDEIILRAIAKIAFNFFAKKTYPLAFNEHFNDIRHFIRYGLKSSDYLLSRKERIVNTQTPQAKTEFYGRHVLSFYQEYPSNRFMAHVSLFNDIGFDVVLSRSYQLLTPYRSKCIFDLRNKLITDVTNELVFA